MINFTLIKNSLPQLLSGVFVSLQISFFAILIGISGGLIIAILSQYKNKIISIAVQFYLLIFRGTPMLIQIMILFFLLPFIGISLSAFWSAVIAIGMNSAAYMSQVFLSGIQSVNKGEIEAAQTLGFSYKQIFHLIILPQTIKAIFPSLTNELITLIKDSSLASLIGVSELTHQGDIIRNQTYDAITAYAAVAIFYLVLTSVLTFVLYLYQKKGNYDNN